MDFVIGFGTLLSRKSLGRTIGQEVAAQKELIPVVVQGYRRLYNIRAHTYVASLKMSAELIERAPANVEEVEGAQFNGLALTVTPAELAALDIREAGYDRQVAEMLHFETGASLGNAYLYISPPEQAWIVTDPAQLLPRWRDIAVARAGAYQVSSAFGQRFDATTYLADGQTLVVDFYRDVLDELLVDGQGLL